MRPAMSAAFSRSCPIRLLVEPLIPLSCQTRLWSVGFYILIALIVASGALLWRAPARAAAPATAESEHGRPRLARRPHLVRARGRAGRSLDRGDRPYLDRRGRRAAALGAAARALSLDLRDRVPAGAAHSALARGRAAAALHPRVGRGPDPRPDQERHRRSSVCIAGSSSSTRWSAMASSRAGGRPRAISPSSISGWRPAG